MVAHRSIRVMLSILTVSGAVVGLWALLAPRSFFDDFPGGGRHWVAGDGPFNEHLVRDVGALNLAVALVTLVAAVTLGSVIVRAAAGAWLIVALPHVTYHATHLGHLPTADRIGEVGSLAGEVILAGAILILASLRPSASASSDETAP